MPLNQLGAVDLVPQCKKQICLVVLHKMGPELCQGLGSKGRVGSRGILAVAAKDKIKTDQIQILIFHSLHAFFKCLGQQNIVRIHKGDVAAVGGLHPCVAGGSYPLLWLGDYLYPFVLAGKFFAELPAFIGGSIVHQNQLKPGKTLAQHAFNALF